MRLSRLLEKYASLSHIGLASQEQAPESRKDIYTIEKLRDVIEETRDKRMETERMPDLDVSGSPLITLLAGYADGQTTTVEYLPERASYYDSSRSTRQEGVFLTFRKGDANSFLKSKEQNVLARTTDTIKAKTIFDRIDVEAIYDEMERRALTMLMKYKPYFSLFKRCRIQYSGARTASIVYDPRQKRFILRLNKEFLVYMSVMNLVNGHPKSTMSSLRDIYREKGNFDPDTDVMAHTLLYVIMHEMGHIFYQHTGKRLGLYSNFDHHDVNIYGDILINLRLTKITGSPGGDVDPRMVPNIGLGKSHSLDGTTQDARESVKKMVGALGGVLRLSRTSVNPALSVQLFRSEPATLLVIFDPGALVALNVPTFVLMNLFKSAQITLGVGLPPPTVKGEKSEGEPPPPPVKITEPLRPGQIVIIKGGEQGVVVSAGEATPNPDIEGDYFQQVQVVPRSRLPPHIQKQIDDEVERITAPPVGRGED